ncbi:hypothetical protein L873DRAFT_1846672 [Choiromyces venosus 120613-1]|uniref:Uncharacterized protein n=1 Tax=Choiromyces venosus 120613-1 TaxID=1336337 RepID=A0A3N4J7U2_9PEZI|nr:hypothetical protein L873DRAFT_1846672 [Choiromyces venosus 120613-1]
MANTQQPTTQNISQAFHNTANGYQDLRTEVDRIPNMPVFDQGTQITQILQQVLNGQRELQAQVGEIQNQVGELQNQWVFPILVWYRSRAYSLTRQQRLPMLLHNSSRAELEPLRYPAGIPVNNLPATRSEFAVLTGKCSARNWRMSILLILHDCQDINSRLLRRRLDSLPCPTTLPLANVGNRLPGTLESRFS